MGRFVPLDQTQSGTYCYSLSVLHPLPALLGRRCLRVCVSARKPLCTPLPPRVFRVVAVSSTFLSFLDAQSRLATSSSVCWDIMNPPVPSAHPRTSDRNSDCWLMYFCRFVRCSQRGNPSLRTFFGFSPCTFSGSSPPLHEIPKHYSLRAWALSGGGFR